MGSIGFSRRFPSIIERRSGADLIACFGGLRELSSSGSIIKRFALLNFGAGVAKVFNGVENVWVVERIVDSNLSVAKESLDWAHGRWLIVFSSLDVTML